ncbi:hypothetical protein SAMN04488071_2298 [Kordiimonas lacus]|uniref:Uncharacterized protein n=1 Tax=Kordiimonas lacus TaxID=637679 RepID=A0A1G7B0H7_9PROT|nr:hypothetical protein SAMN04488071_2298 [Kordiimonas lacus]
MSTEYAKSIEFEVFARAVLSLPNLNQLPKARVALNNYDRHAIQQNWPRDCHVLAKELRKYWQERTANQGH